MIKPVYNCPVATLLDIESGVGNARTDLLMLKGAAEVSSVGVVTMVSPLFWPRGHFAGVENA